MEYVQGKELAEFMESQKNKMKTNIKMKCDDSQFRKVMNILKIDYKSSLHYEDMYIIINNDLNVDFGYGGTIYNDSNCKEIDADLFIRTSGTCQETFKDRENAHYKEVDEFYKKVEASISDLIIIELRQKLKKKNEILKKARIKRKNQREELHKLNLKLQKCISLEELEYIKNDNKHILQLKEQRIKDLEDCNERVMQQNKYIKDSLNNIMDIRNNQSKEIEKLKAVIEYLESKVK